MHRSKQHLYSITSSASEGNNGGTVRPSALLRPFQTIRKSFPKQVAEPEG
jgi:hypothetical protein